MNVKQYIVLALFLFSLAACNPDVSKTSSANKGAIQTKNETPPTEMHYVPGEVLNVFSKAGLNLRATPGDLTSKITQIYFGTEVKVLPDSTPKIAFSTNELVGFPISGHWVKVAYKNKSGYLFDGYLSPRPTPKKGEGFDEYLQRTAGKILQKDSVKPTNDTTNVFEYKYLVYADGTSTIFKAYEGGFSHDIIFAPGKITLAEAYLLIKNMTVNKNPKYSFDASKRVLLCENDDSVWTVSETNGQVSVNYSFAD